MQPVDLTLTYVYKTKKYLISEKEEITYKNIIKQYKKLILMMLQKKETKAHNPYWPQIPDHTEY